jgi:capsular polysaccharide biosynthesis protein
MYSKKTIYPAITVHRNAPVNFKSGDAALFSAEWTKEIDEISIVEKPHVAVGESLTFYNGKFPDTLLNDLNPKYSSPSFFGKIITTLKERVLYSSLRLDDEIVWIIDEWSSGYYHWMMEALARLTVAKMNAQGKKSIIVALPESFKAIRFVAETLSFFGATLFYLKPNTLHEIGKIVFPTAITPIGNFNPLVLADLKSFFLTPVSPPARASNRIYISRGKAKRRKLLNEDEILDILKEHDFKIYHFEELSFAEQLELSRNAECMMSLHGAGLTNMLFMPTESSVIELRRKGDSQANCYFSMANALGLRYFYFECENSTPDHHGDFVINANVFKSEMNLFCTKDHSLS